MHEEKQPLLAAQILDPFKGNVLFCCGKGSAVNPDLVAALKGWGYHVGQFTHEEYVQILEYSPKENATIEGNKVTWDLTQAQADTVELMIKWKPAGGFNISAILLILAAIGGLALVAIGAFLALRNQRSEPAPTAEDQSADENE